MAAIRIKRLANGGLQTASMGRYHRVESVGGRPPGVQAAPGYVFGTEREPGRTDDPAYERARQWRAEHPQPFDEAPSSLDVAA